MASSSRFEIIQFKSSVAGFPISVTHTHNPSLRPHTRFTGAHLYDGLLTAVVVVLPIPASSVFHDNFTLIYADKLPLYHPTPDEEGERHEHPCKSQDQEEQVQDKLLPSSYTLSDRDTACSGTKQGRAVRPKKPAPTEELVDEPVTKRAKAEKRFMLRDRTSLLRENYMLTPSTTPDAADVEAFCEARMRKRKCFACVIWEMEALKMAMVGNRAKSRFEGKEGMYTQ